MSSQQGWKCFTRQILHNFGVSGFTYPIVSHWVWSPDGWLLKLGYFDFSGAGAVHLLAGTCSFVAALFIGPRLGRFSFDNSSNKYTGHSTPVRTQIIPFDIILYYCIDIRNIYKTLFEGEFLTNIIVYENKLCLKNVCIIRFYCMYKYI